MKQGELFRCNGRVWKVESVFGGYIFAECVSERIIPATQMFKVADDGEIIKV